jgi:predicted DCC family thiol-disulfide oxidoreductase YuxK
MSEWRFKLLYDGGCPFCRLEARWLQRWNRHGRLAFEDITAPEFNPARYGVTREDVMGVMHGVFPDGTIVRKVEAFRQAYRAVGLGWLLAPTGWPVLRWICDGLYALFARYRVSVGRIFGGSCPAGTCDVSARRQKKHADP